MGLVDTSYQPWSGDFLPRWRRIGAIVATGLKLAFAGLMTKLVLFMIYGIVTVSIGILYIVASSNVELPLALGNNLYREYLNAVPYGMLLMLLTAMVGSRLISRDLKYNSTAMYFSKAITRTDYLAGKFGVIAVFLLSATWVPAVALWIGQFAMGREPVVWADRIRDLLGITAHAVIIVVPSSALILAFSSLSRTAYIPGVLYTFVYFGSQIAGWIFEERVGKPWCKLVTWQNLTAHLGNLCYPLRPVKLPYGQGTFTSPAVMEYGWREPALILGAVTVIAVALVLWRLRRLEGNE